MPCSLVLILGVLFIVFYNFFICLYVKRVCPELYDEVLGGRFLYGAKDERKLCGILFSGRYKDFGFDRKIKLLLISYRGVIFIYFFFFVFSLFVDC